MTRAAIIVALLVLPGCGGEADSIVVGQTLEITLKTIGSGKYAQPSISSPAVEFLGMGKPDFITPGGPTQLFRFRGAAAGNATIVMEHIRNYPQGVNGLPPPYSPFRRTVIVRDLVAGLPATWP